MATRADPTSDPAALQGEDEAPEPDAPGLTYPQRLARGVVVAVLLAVGVAGGYTGVRARERDDAFVLHQLHPTLVKKTDVDKMVATAPEPVSKGRGTPSVSTNCHPANFGDLRSPWKCTVRYRSGRTAHYDVNVEHDGHFTGTGSGRFSGCCISVPIVRPDS